MVTATTASVHHRQQQQQHEEEEEEAAAAESTFFTVAGTSILDTTVGVVSRAAHHNTKRGGGQRRRVRPRPGAGSSRRLSEVVRQNPSAVDGSRLSVVGSYITEIDGASLPYGQASRITTVFLSNSRLIDASDLATSVSRVVQARSHSGPNLINYTHKL
jgi:hypothetical protein